jgi:hypothetical protein
MRCSTKEIPNDSYKVLPRCHGDMMKEELLGEVESVCLQCGHRTYPEAQTRLPRAPVSVAKKAA